MAEGGDTNFRELLQRIETALCDAAEVDAASFLQTLQRAKPSFLNLFRYKASVGRPAVAVWGGRAAVLLV